LAFTTVTRVRELAGNLIAEISDAEIQSHISGAEAEVSARTAKSDWDYTASGQEIVNDTTAALAALRAIAQAMGNRMTESYTLGSLPDDKKYDDDNISILIKQLNDIAERGIIALRKIANKRKVVSSTT